MHKLLVILFLIKLNARINAYGLLYMCYVVETYFYIDESGKEAFSNRIMHNFAKKKNRGAQEG